MATACYNPEAIKHGLDILNVAFVLKSCCPSRQLVETSLSFYDLSPALAQLARTIHRQKVHGPRFPPTAAITSVLASVILTSDFRQIPSTTFEFIRVSITHNLRFPLFQSRLAALQFLV